MKAMFLCSFLLFLMMGCSAQPEAKSIAEVYGQKLKASQLNAYLEKRDYVEDSAKSAEIFINDWIKKQVILHAAKKANISELQDIESKVENYRSQLQVHHFQNKLIKKRLDTVVLAAEIKDYYLKHQPDFQLKDYLVKVLYIKVAEDAPDLDELGKWYKIKNSEDELSIIQYAGMYASNFYFDKNNWIYFDEITKEIPLTDIKKDKFITQKSKIKFKEGNYYYFLNIIDYKLKNAVSPLEFEKNNIKKRILNTRILQLREKITQELLLKAQNENAITKY